jgi:hypothetical protein
VGGGGCGCECVDGWMVGWIPLWDWGGLGWVVVVVVVVVKGGVESEEGGRWRRWNR